MSDLTDRIPSKYHNLLPQDFLFGDCGSKEEILQTYNEVQEKIRQIEREETNIYNAVELMEMGDIEQHYLMEPIFPQKGSAVLAGKPDTGKSQFARQLCIQVAMGKTDFIGFKINPVYNKAIYVATEDNIDNTKFLLSKQMTGLGEEAKENLRFMFADTMEQDDILIQLDKALTAEPADLVVVDSFGDIFKGGDTNNNMAMRNTVKMFDKIAKNHNCLILFVHHVNKGAYRIAPAQEHIQGGAGLLQKVRLAIQLSEGDGNIRYFSVVKGNYCSKEFKQNSLILNFSEETFLFSNTGKTKPTNEIGMQVNNFNKEEKYNELEEAATTIFSDKAISYGDFVKQFCQITGKSVPTAKRAIANLLKLTIIEKCDGNYKLISKKSQIVENENEFDDEH